MDPTFVHSYNDIAGDVDRELFNSTFTEVRKYIEINGKKLRLLDY